MSVFKRFFALSLMVSLCISAVRGQSSGSEQSVEESYLQESIELMLIKEQTRADSLDQKETALQYIGDAIDGGNTGEDIRQVLEYLSMEGVLNKSMVEGRITNNFPTVRMKAAEYLGKVGTPEAKNTLLKICNVDNEPSVITEAVKSLGIIGNNDNNDTVNTIFWNVNRFDRTNPDNRLAKAAIDAFRNIAEKNNGLRDLNAIQLLLRISEGPYIQPVRTEAKQLLTDLRKYSAQEKK